MLEGSMDTKGVEGMGTASDAHLRMRTSNPLLVRFLGWSSDSMAFRDGS